LRVVVVRSEKLVAEAADKYENPEEEERPPLQPLPGNG
jgi:hypothetical protein